MKANEQINTLCEEVLADYPDKVNNYRLGKKALIGLFLGEVMKRSKGQINPTDAIKNLQKLLSSNNKR